MELKDFYTRLTAEDVTDHPCDGCEHKEYCDPDMFEGDLFRCERYTKNAGRYYQKLMLKAVSMIP